MTRLMWPTVVVLALAVTRTRWQLQAEFDRHAAAAQALAVDEPKHEHLPDMTLSEYAAFAAIADRLSGIEWFNGPADPLT